MHIKIAPPPLLYAKFHFLGKLHCCKFGFNAYKLADSAHFICIFTSRLFFRLHFYKKNAYKIAETPTFICIFQDRLQIWQFNFKLLHINSAASSFLYAQFLHSIFNTPPLAPFCSYRFATFLPSLYFYPKYTLIISSICFVFNGFLRDSKV